MKPVALPPGCARLSTKPAPTGSTVDVNTMGTLLVACSNGPVVVPATRNNDVWSCGQNFGNLLANVDHPGRHAVNNQLQIAVRDPTDAAQCFHEGCKTPFVIGIVFV